MHHSGAFSDPTIKSAEKSSQLVSLKNSQSSEKKKKAYEDNGRSGIIAMLEYLHCYESIRLGVGREKAYLPGQGRVSPGSRQHGVLERKGARGRLRKYEQAPNP